MRVNSPGYKNWKKRKDFLVWKKRLERENLKFRLLNTFSKPEYKKNRKVFDMPKNFSLINNFEEVIKTFDNIKFLMGSENFSFDEILLNFKDVKSITIDALMYLLVFMKNTKNPQKQYIHLIGNLPTDESCALKMKNCGFLDYLSTGIKSETSNENIKINAGDLIITDVFRNICDFVHEKLACTRLDTKELYNSLGEIVGNSIEHAYFNTVKWHKWLTFAKYEDNKIKIVLLDTGMGIIKTMKRRILKDIFYTNKALLQSALEGKNRSETNLLYRNKGLPQIRYNAMNDTLKNLTLITNNIIYQYKNCDKMELFEELNCSLDGTLYYFEYYK